MENEEKKRFIAWLINEGFLDVSHGDPAMQTPSPSREHLLQILADHRVLKADRRVIWQKWCVTQSPDEVTLPAQQRQASSPKPSNDHVVIANRYKVEKKLGEGGFGVVYLATDTALSRQVAIKVIKGALTPEDVNEFVAEARTTAEMQHPNVVTVFDVGVHQHAPYVVMEFIKGESLQDACKKLFPSLGRNVPAEEQQAARVEILRLLTNYVCGVAGVHRQGKVHRDLKPENGQVQASTGLVKVLDFGLAVEADKPAPSAGGTVPFMSPEQAQQWSDATGGIHTLALSRESDVYTLGKIFYWALTGGKLLHKSKAAFAALAEIMKDADKSSEAALELTALGYDKALVDIVARCLSGEPKNRYTTAAELYEDLQVRQREQAREIWLKRLKLVGVVALLLVTLFSGLSTVAFYRASVAASEAATAAKAKAEAEEQARLALEQEAEAQEQARLALEQEAEAQEQARLALEQEAQTAKELAETQAASIAAIQSRNRVAAHSALARNLLERYQWNEAVTEFTAALAVYPAEVHAEHADLLGPLFMERARAYFHLRDSECVVDMESAISLVDEPLKSEALFWVVVYSVTLSTSTEKNADRIDMITNDRYRKLLTVFTASVPNNPEERERVRRRGRVLLEGIPEAERDWVWYFIYAHTRSFLDGMDGVRAALDAYNQSIRMEPDFGLSYMNRAQMYTNLSVEHLRQAQAEQGDGPYRKLCGVYARLAMEDCRRLNLLMPEWKQVTINYVDPLCLYTYFCADPRRNELLDEGLEMVRPYWEQSDEELGRYRFDMGLRMLQLLQMKCILAGGPQQSAAKSYTEEGAKVWSRLNNGTLTREQMQLTIQPRRVLGLP